MAITLNTNSAAFIALANLRTVQDALQASEKMISTGYTVSDALDNGAVFGVAQSVRGSIAGNTAVSQELGNFSGLVTVAAAAATQISNNLSDIRSTLSHLSTAALDGVSRQQYTVQLKSLVDSVNNFIKGAQYGETNLLNTTQNFDILADHQNGNVLKVIGGNYSLNLAYTDLTNAANGPTFTTAQTTALTTARGSLVTALSTASGAVTGAANTAAAT
ncbi:MAG: hypothetical protein ORO03_03195, partial [Alphaproteobacteria bacterium]|nr:hypothetical protein [Alphaproteobacteria bacterium]